VLAGFYGALQALPRASCWVQQWGPSGHLVPPWCVLMTSVLCALGPCLPGVLCEREQGGGTSSLAFALVQRRAAASMCAASLVCLPKQPS
jgi:hypothetical protein